MFFETKITPKGPKLNYITNKTDFFFFSKFFGVLHILDLKDYVPENPKGCIYLLVVIDKFSKFG